MNEVKKTRFSVTFTDGAVEEVNAADCWLAEGAYTFFDDVDRSMMSISIPMHNVLHVVAEETDETTSQG